MKRCAVIHGHFYQPPRENPWTGEVERQPSAGRDHDWNARVARECYVPNGEARVVNGAGQIVDLVTNYNWISYDFGPTLLAWYEKAHPHGYARLLQSDRDSAARLGGHGNAMAQAYHHSILPLCNARDRRTEILWGLADFKHRFGREAEAMWLPECAVDDATLTELSRAGVKFTILEPHQAESVRPITGGDWWPAAELLKPGVPYLWRGPEGDELTLFFYDGKLSQSVAFENAMSDSRAFAARVAARLPAVAEDALCLIATDGETYGHHHAFAEMGLAHLLRHALGKAGVSPVNLGWYLAKNPPANEARLGEGATSWSCAHGVERWRGDCGCGAQPGRHQRWRQPLRRALENLRDRLAALYEERGATLFTDPWQARDAYISVVLDRSPESVDRFIASHAPGAKDELARIQALKLLEMQRHSLMMFTSCGWFFDELSRIEPVQILLYAARALDLAREFGEEFEADFLEDLSHAPSNEPSLKDGAGIWARLVKPRVVTPNHVAATFAMSLLFDDRPAAGLYRQKATCERFTRRAAEGVTVAAGSAEFVDELTGERWKRCFFAGVLPGQRVQAFICGDLPPDRFEALLADASQGRQSSPLPPGRIFLLRDLPLDARERILTKVLKRRLSHWQDGALELLEEALPLVEQFRGLDLPLPAGLADETRLTLSQAFNAAASDFAAGGPGALAEARSVLSRAQAAGFKVEAEGAEADWSAGISRVLDLLEKDFSDPLLRELHESVAIAILGGLGDWRQAAQTRFFRVLPRGAALSPAARDAAQVLGIATPSVEPVKAPEAA